MTMKQPTISGWKFIHPDLEQIVEPGIEEYAESGQVKKKLIPTGLTLTSRTSAAMVTNNQAVRQSILMLLSTQPGERVMRPEYGCDLRQLVFSPNDDTTAGIAIYLVRSALLQWEPRIDILDLDAGPDPQNPSVLIISLKYQVRITKSNDEIQLAVNLAGEMP
jgi:uncharacterized protein